MDYEVIGKRERAVGKMILVVIGIFLIIALAGGQREEIDTYLMEQIGKEIKNTVYFREVLEVGIEECNEQSIYRIGFPKEAKSYYSSFLRMIGRAAKYQVGESEQGEDGSYHVEIFVTPVDMQKTLQKRNNEYAAAMNQEEYAEAIKEMLQMNKELLDTPIMGEQTAIMVTLTQTKKGWHLEKEELYKIIDAALIGYMKPYTTVARAFHTRACLQAYLDLGLKGETALYSWIFEETEDKAIQFYESVFVGNELFLGWDLSEEQKERGKVAAKRIYKNSSYFLKAASIEEDGNCSIQIRIYPNTSFREAGKELETKAENGEYIDMSDVAEGLIQLLEKYAQSPTYEDEIEMTISVNYLLAAKKQGDGSWWSELENTMIVPMEE